MMLFPEKTGSVSKSKDRKRNFGRNKGRAPEPTRQLSGPEWATNRVIGGLQRGLNKFCGTTKVALVVAVREDDPIVIYDDHGLLDSQKDDLRKRYVTSSLWRERKTRDLSADEDVSFIGDIGLPGILSLGATSSSVFYQRWFVERVPNLAHEGPIYSWLEDAAYQMSSDLEPGEKYWNNFSYAELADNSLTAVVGYLYQAEQRLLEQRGLRMPNPFPIVDSVSRISVAREEGERATGRIMFVHRDQLDYYLKYHLELDSFDKNSEATLPPLSNTKHVRKLLTLCGTDRYLLSDGEFLRGIADLREPTPENSIVAEFRHGRGDIRLGTKLVCTFADGELYGDSGSVNLWELNRLLQDRNLEPHLRERLLPFIESILTSAKLERYGCTLVIDFHDPVRRLPGEYLREPINGITNSDLISAMAKIDGALHLSPKAELFGFACLLDGEASINEDRSRGARYNSALRFSAKEEQEDTIVLVVSADGPISIFEKGFEVTTSTLDLEDTTRLPTPIADWINLPEAK